MSNQISNDTVEFIFKTIQAEYKTASNETKEQWSSILEFCKVNTQDASIKNKIDYYNLLIKSYTVNLTTNLTDNLTTNLITNDNQADNQTTNPTDNTEAKKAHTNLQIIAQTYFDIDEDELKRSFDVEGLEEFYITHDHEAALLIFARKQNYLMLGYMYLEGVYIKQNFTKAMEYFKLADNGYGDIAIGNMYYHRRGVAQNLNTATDYYQKAADVGCSMGLTRLCYVYRNNPSSGRTFCKARGFCEKAVAMGNSNAFVEMGELHFHGRGVSQNLNKSIEYYQKAADMGNLQGLRELGYMYYHGKGVAEDTDKAIEYYQAAVDKGYLPALQQLGFVYKAQNNISKALEFYEKAASLGYAKSYAELGHMYYAGAGVNIDLTQALIYYTKASELHIEENQNMEHMITVIKRSINNHINDYKEMNIKLDKVREILKIR